MKVTILKEGVSQEVNGSTTYAKVGELLEVSAAAAIALVRDGFAEYPKKTDKVCRAPAVKAVTPAPISEQKVEN